MEELKSRRRKENLKILFNIQGGKCCYCKGETVLNPPATDLLGKRLPKYMATLEHLIPSGEHTCEDREDIKNQKMACKYCNELIGNLPSRYRSNFFGKLKRPSWINEGMKNNLQKSGT